MLQNAKLLSNYPLQASHLLLSSVIQTVVKSVKCLYYSTTIRLKSRDLRVEKKKSSTNTSY